jgi:hypothetical protein
MAHMTDQELEVIEAEMPSLANVLRDQQAEIEELQARKRQEDEVRAAAVRAEIQDTIDQNATLAAWQTAVDKTAWNEALRFDRMLRESPKYANVSFEDRFKKVVELTQTALETSDRRDQHDEPDRERPGGRLPSGKDLESMSATQIAGMLGGKSPDEIQAFLAGL